jgi:hypothetical protein
MDDCLDNRSERTISSPTAEDEVPSFQPFNMTANTAKAFFQKLQAAGHAQ